MTDKVWQEINDSLDKLHKDVAVIRFYPLIEKVKQWASATRYPPDYFLIFIELIRQMGKEVKEGLPVQAVLEQAASGTGAYYQPAWDVDKIYQTNGSFFQTIVNVWREEVENEVPNPKYPLPVVLLVMQEKEAFELVSGAAFEGYPKELREDFDRLQQSLILQNMENWVQNYKQEPTAWQPFKDKKESIEQLINQALLRIEGFQKQIIPDFIDIRTLNEELHREKLRNLRNDGCVVILDVISMQHPAIQRQFRRSLLDVFPTTIVARVAPVMDALRLEQRVIFIIEQHIEMEFHKRVSVDLDAQCEEIFNPIGFARWLKNQVPKLLPDDLRDPRKSWHNYNISRR